MIDDEGKMVQKKSHQLKPGTALGWFDKDKLISQIVVLPFQVNIHGVIYEMGELLESEHIQNMRGMD